MSFIRNLPKNLQYLIFDYLNIKEMQKLRSSCKYFSSPNSPLDTFYWKKLCDKHWSKMPKIEQISWKEHYNTCSKGDLRKAAEKGKLVCNKVLISSNNMLNFVQINLVHSKLCASLSPLNTDRTYNTHDVTIGIYDCNTKEKNVWINGEIKVIDNLLFEHISPTSCIIWDIKEESQLLTLDLYAPLSEFKIRSNAEFIFLIDHMHVYKILILKGAKIGLQENGICFSSPPNLVTAHVITDGEINLSSDHKLISINQLNDRYKLYDLDLMTARTFNIENSINLSKLISIQFINDRELISLYEYGQIEIKDLISNNTNNLWIGMSPRKGYTWDFYDTITVLKVVGDFIVTGSLLGRIDIWPKNFKTPLCTLKMFEPFIIDNTPVIGIEATASTIIAHTKNVIKIWEIDSGSEDPRSIIQFHADHLEAQKTDHSEVQKKNTPQKKCILM